MSALQLWLQNHNRRLAQDAIDEALMEYITHVEKQRDELLAALERLSFAAMCRDSTMGDPCRLIEVRAELAAANKQACVIIASVKEKQDASDCAGS